MNPRLQVLAGPLTGASYALNETDFSIGRASSNQLCLVDGKVSRMHCIITKDGAGFKIRDLGSQNGTHVNALPIEEKLLEDGDQIRIGESQFAFLIEGDAPLVLTTTVDLHESELRAQSTVLLNAADSLYLQYRKPEREALPEKMWIHDLNVLFRISMAINSIGKLKALAQKMLELIFEIVPAERGAILFLEENSDQFSSVFGFERIAGPTQTIQVSRTIVERVVKEGTAILVNEILSDDSFSAADSLTASRIESLLCVPLTIFGKVIGVIYLDTSDRKTLFDEHHLQLMTAIAAIAAVAAKNAQHLEWLEGENRRLQVDIDLQHDMVGESPPIRDVFQFIAKVAPTDSTVLITGESGTGKELAARAIHQSSRRSAKPFVAINCAVLTESLLESELFGHEKGAFTGAVAQKKGKLEIANGGTVFLDEMGELTPAIQAKLLRVLEERQFERVGSTRPIKVDIRLIAATNRDLDEAVQTGIIRKDLYYRLNVVSLKMPLLRERREDIPLLARYFVRKCAKKARRRISAISPAAEECLLAYAWPGNVRELENAIERAVVLGSTEILLPEDLPEPIIEAQMPLPNSAASFHEAVRESKKQIILNALEQMGGDYSETARLLGLHVNNLHRLIRNLDLKQKMKKDRTFS
jgi:transcriptional regulator with GAF, ATPase, and Fis domain